MSTYRSKQIANRVCRFSRGFPPTTGYLLPFAFTHCHKYLKKYYFINYKVIIKYYKVIVKYYFLQITFGRSSSDLRVDIDFSLEGPTWKISRRHGIIKMTNDGKFFLHNQGRRPVFINGLPVVTGSSMQLQHNSALEVLFICSLSFFYFYSISILFCFI